MLVRECEINAPFAYLLSLTKLAGGVNQREAGDDPEPILPGQISRGQIGLADMEACTRSGAVTDVITCALLRTNGTSGNPTLSVYDPQGNLAFESCGDG